MFRRLRRKRAAVALAAVASLALAAGAYAFFSSTGSGTGTASVGTSSGIALSSATPVSNLYPGGADVPVTVSVHNPGAGAENVGTISGKVADNGGCLGSWFQVDDITYNHDIAAGNDGPNASTKVRMLDSNTNQDACQGKTLTINWSSN